MKNSVIAVTNEKGGVGKTTTTVNLAQGLVLTRSFQELVKEDPERAKVCVIDFDPQGNSTQISGIKYDGVKISIADLIRDRSLPEEAAIHRGEFIDIIPSSPTLRQVKRELPGLTNAELRLAQRIKKLKSRYSVIIIDAPPEMGAMMNSVLNAADYVIIPVDSDIAALNGIKSLLGEMEEIRLGTNPNLQVLGYLLTLCDATRVTTDIFDTLIQDFGDLVFQTKIRRTVKLREARILARTIFHHAPNSTGAEDYLNLAEEVMQRLSTASADIYPISSKLAQGVSHE